MKAVLSQKLKITPGQLTKAYLCAVFIALPLLLHRSYSDTTLVKAVCFWVLSGLYLLTLLLLLARRGEFPMPGKLPVGELAFPLFALITLLASLCSGHAAESLLAENNRCQGILTFLLLPGLFFAVRRYGSLDRALRGAMLGTFFFVSLLAILNQFHLDPLGFLSVIRLSERMRFSSTVGNVDMLGAYCALMLPVSVVLLLFAERKKALGMLPAVLIGFGGTLSVRTEGAVLGLTAAFLIMPLLCRNDLRALRRCALLPPAAAIAAGIYALLVSRFHAWPLSELTLLFVSPAVTLGIAVGGLLLWLALGKEKDTDAPRLARAWGQLLMLFLLILSVFLLLANTLLREHLSEKVSAILVFSDSWGSDRGLIWKSCFTLFSRSPLLSKLFGGGVGSLARWDLEHRLFPDAVTDAAHNEYLHYLLSSGLVGLAAYLAALAHAAVRAFRNPGPGRLALFAGCVGYAAQGLVGISFPVATPLFFLLLALLSGDAEEDTSRKPSAAVGCLLLAAGILLFGVVSTARLNVPRSGDFDAPYKTGLPSDSEYAYAAGPLSAYVSPAGSSAVCAHIPALTRLEISGYRGQYAAVSYGGRSVFVRRDALISSDSVGKGFAVAVTVSPEGGDTELLYSLTGTLRSELEDRGYTVLSDNSEADVSLCLYVNTDDTISPGAAAFRVNDTEPYSDESAMLAERLLSGLTAAAGCRDKGVSSLDGLQFSSPAVCLCVGSLCDEREAEMLYDSDYQFRIAWGLANGLDLYVLHDSK